MYEYDAWHDRNLRLDYWNNNNESHVNLSLDPYKGILIICGQAEDDNLPDPLYLTGERAELNNFTQSVARAIDYPNFTGSRAINCLESYGNTDKRFSGYIRYETVFMLGEYRRVALEITDAYEGVEVFVNGGSAGIQVVPVFLYDLTGYCRTG